jgi:outer membrane protein assembly factor BamB
MTSSHIKTWAGPASLGAPSSLAAHRKGWLKSPCLLAILLAGSVLATAQDGEFNSPTNTLIADQFNNRVIEVDLHGNIVWHFGLGPNDYSPASINGTNDAERVGEFTLMAGTGTPAGQPEAAPICQPGCADNRVLLVDRDGNIVWQYGQFGVTGSDSDQLNVPVQATWLPNRHVLITDQSNERIIEVDVETKATVWQYGTTGISGNGDNQLNNPNCALLLKNGHILICDENNNRAIEVIRKLPLGGTIVWQYGSGDPNVNDPVSGVAFASRLKNGDTLITDSNHNRIVEIDQHQNVVWEYFTCSGADCNLARGTGPLPTRAVRLRSGHTLISDQYNHRVIEVNRGKQIVRTFGQLGSMGYNADSVAGGGLNSPYDAKRIGDFTGLTPPFPSDRD